MGYLGAIEPLLKAVEENLILFVYKAMVRIENVIKVKYFNIFSFSTISYEITCRMCLYGEGGHAFKNQENEEH